MVTPKMISEIVENISIFSILSALSKKLFISLKFVHQALFQKKNSDNFSVLSDKK